MIKFISLAFVVSGFTAHRDRPALPSVIFTQSSLISCCSHAAPLTLLVYGLVVFMNSQGCVTTAMI